MRANIATNAILFAVSSPCPSVCPCVCLSASPPPFFLPSHLLDGGPPEPSAAESPVQGGRSISEEELISAIREAQGLAYETTAPETPRPAAGRGTPSRPEPLQARPGLPTIPSPQDPEASSAESGDSEIELVSEDPLAPTAEEALPPSYAAFGHAGGPPPSPASPSIQYSILREEREAELDSDLILESCDVSSASEESPKREQDSPPMKPGALDAIREEPGGVAVGSSEEDMPSSRRGLAQKGPCHSLASDQAPPTRRELPPSGQETPQVLPGHPTMQRPQDAAAPSSIPSRPATKVPEPWGAGLESTLLFFNKQKGKVGETGGFFLGGEMGGGRFCVLMVLLGGVVLRSNFETQGPKI